MKRAIIGWLCLVFGGVLLSVTLADYMLGIPYSKPLGTMGIKIVISISVFVIGYILKESWRHPKTGETIKETRANEK